MTITLYVDQHVPRAITSGLRLNGVDVLTAYEDGGSGLDDSALLDRATTLGRVLFSQDDDLLAEAQHRQENGIEFAGVIYAHQLRISIGQAVLDLQLIAHAGNPPDLLNQVLYLPL